MLFIVQLGCCYRDEREANVATRWPFVAVLLPCTTKNG